MTRRLVLFICLAIMCYVLGSGIIYMIVSIKGMTPAVMRISAVVQDLVVFIVPAMALAVMITRLPARFLCIDRRPRLSVALLACATLVVAMPALNALIEWNESISLPESMSGVEQAMRAAEVSARSQIAILFGNGSVASVVLAVCIVGVLAALAEELFFRGAFQRLLTTGGVPAWLAVVGVAFIFSAMHMQFYGFFGRFALGVYFGYLLVWSRNLWIPVIVHAFNNSVYVIANRGIDTTMIGERSSLDTFGQGSALIIAVSIVLTAVGLYVLYKMTKNRG